MIIVDKTHHQSSLAIGQHGMSMRLVQKAFGNFYLGNIRFGQKLVIKFLAETSFIDIPCP
jgi:hypothetical protein